MTTVISPFAATRTSWSLPSSTSAETEVKFKRIVCHGYYYKTRRMSRCYLGYYYRMYLHYVITLNLSVYTNSNFISILSRHATV